MVKTKILITGGSGFLASHIADYFSYKKFNVILLDKKKSEFKRRDQKMIICDILNKKKLEKKLKNIDIVFHFAAEADLFKSNENPYYTIQCNVIGTSNLLEACIKNKVKKIVYASSIYALSEQGGFYSLSKLSSEMIIENYNKKFNIDFVILRFGSIYGGRANSFNTIQNFINQAIHEKKILRNSNGKEIRNFINVKDVSKICFEIIKKNYKNKYFNIYGPTKNKVYEILNLIKEFLPNTKIIYNKSKKMKYNYIKSPFTYKLRRGKTIYLNKYITIREGINSLIKRNIQ